MNLFNTKHALYIKDIKDIKDEDKKEYEGEKNRKESIIKYSSLNDNRLDKIDRLIININENNNNFNIDDYDFLTLRLLKNFSNFRYYNNKLENKFSTFKNEIDYNFKNYYFI